MVISPSMKLEIITFGEDAVRLRPVRRRPAGLHPGRRSTGRFCRSGPSSRFNRAESCLIVPNRAKNKKISTTIDESYPEEKSVLGPSPLSPRRNSGLYSLSVCVCVDLWPNFHPEEFRGCIPMAAPSRFDQIRPNSTKKTLVASNRQVSL